jgi:hypothetical protein
MGEARHDGNCFGYISALPRKADAGASYLVSKITSDKALYRSQLHHQRSKKGAVTQQLNGETDHSLVYSKGIISGGL